MRFFCIEKCCISFILISYPTWLYPTASTGLLPRQQYVCASLSYGYIKSLACRGSGVSIYLRWIERVFDVHQCHQFDVTHDVWHVQIFETWFFEVVVPGSSVAFSVCVWSIVDLSLMAIHVHSLLVAQLDLEDFTSQSCIFSFNMFDKEKHTQWERERYGHV